MLYSSVREDVEILRQTSLAQPCPRSVALSSALTPGTHLASENLIHLEVYQPHNLKT